MFSMKTATNENNEKPLLILNKHTLSIEKSKMNSQSPKYFSGKLRPVTSLGFSKIDLKEKFVNLKGVTVNQTYERETMHEMYPDKVTKAYNAFTDYKEEEQRIKKCRLDSAANYKPLSTLPNFRTDTTYPLDKDYFLPYNNEYKDQLASTQKDFFKLRKKKKEIQDKSNESNVLTTDRSKTTMNFFSSSKKSATQKDYHESDIFNQNEKISSYKTSEKYTVTEYKNLEKPYTVSSRSNSEWIALNANPSLLNHSSTNFHPLNPGIKNISKTKENIMKFESFNPIHRQKMLCEYIDVTRVGCPNPAKEFRQVYKENKFLFNKTSDLCSNFLDNHNRNYKVILKPPFKK